MRTFTTDARRAGARWARRTKPAQRCGLRAHPAGSNVSALKSRRELAVARHAREDRWSSLTRVASYPTAAAPADRRSRTAARGQRTDARRRPSKHAPRCGRKAGGVSARGQPETLWFAATRNATQRVGAPGTRAQPPLLSHRVLRLPRRTSGWRGGRPGQSRAGQCSRQPCWRRVRRGSGGGGRSGRCTGAVRGITRALANG